MMDLSSEIKQDNIFQKEMGVFGFIILQRVA